jgi:1,4-dihydroxy-2-naphthoyl-CoA synthase
MTAKVLYDKRGEVAYITLSRPEVKNAIDIESHELLYDIWRDFRDDPELRVAVITGSSPMRRQRKRDGAITTVLRQGRSRRSRGDSYSPLTTEPAPLCVIYAC